MGGPPVVRGHDLRVHGPAPKTLGAPEHRVQKIACTYGGVDACVFAHMGKYVLI